MPGSANIESNQTVTGQKRWWLLFAIWASCAGILFSIVLLGLNTALHHLHYGSSTHLYLALRELGFAILIVSLAALCSVVLIGGTIYSRKFAWSWLERTTEQVWLQVRTAGGPDNIRAG
jgi:hypothetical protein